MASPLPEHASWQAWAAAKLGVPTDASTDDVCRAFLVQLETDEFVPSNDKLIALKLRLRSFPQAEPPDFWLNQFREERAKELGRAVEAFAREYWALPIVQRQTNHAELLAAAADFPLTKAHLERLRKGLEVESVIDGEGNPEQTLVRKVQDLYALTPQDQALGRQELLDQLHADPAGPIAFQRLLEDYPEVARLHPGMNQQFLSEENPLDYRAFLSSKLNASLSPAPTSFPASLFARLGNYAYLLIPALSLLIGIILAASQIGRGPPRPQFAPKDPVPTLGDAHLKVISHPDGTRTVETFDRNDQPIRSSESLKRLLGSKELLEKYDKEHKN
jgi:hypothetical protein